jgi:putative transposase
VVWRRLEAVLPSTGRVGRPYTNDRRTVLEAIVSVMQTGCGWRGLPDQFPPWQTVSAQLSRWKETGIWDQIWTGLSRPLPSF